MRAKIAVAVIAFLMLLAAASFGISHTGMFYMGDDKISFVPEGWVMIGRIEMWSGRATGLVL